MKKFILLSFLLTGILLSCKQENSAGTSTTSSANETSSADPANKDVWADQVEANTSLIKPDGWADDEWKAVNINVDQQKIYTTLFDAVKSGKQKAYDFFTDSAYTTDQIKERLMEIKVSDVSAMRTRESWSFDKENFKMEKKITRISLFTPKLDESGNYLGDKALFYVKLN